MLSEWDCCWAPSCSVLSCSSPQQVSALSNKDARSDLWSFSCAEIGPFYHLFCTVYEDESRGNCPSCGVQGKLMKGPKLTLSLSLAPSLACSLSQGIECYSEAKQRLRGGSLHGSPGRDAPRRHRHSCTSTGKPLTTWISLV